MKKIFTITLLSFLFFACQNDAQQATPAETTNAVSDTQAEHDDHAGHDHGDAPHHHEASAMSPFDGKWLYYYAIKETEKYKGRFIDLRANGSFVSGANDVQTNSGTWTLDEATNIIDLDYADNSKEKDEQWKAQSNTPNVIILIGNTPKNASGNQIKLERVPR